jgi:two-component system, NarL family, nitrate/nitrite response regulator NarL
VDDHPIVLEGIKSHLAAQEDLEVVGEAANGQEAVRKARQLAPDIILMDVSMPKMNGLEAMSILRRQAPEAKILILTMHENKEYISQVINLGARGYMLKDSPPAELVQAIRLIHEGQVYLSPAISRVMLDELVNHNSKRRIPVPDMAEISGREREVLILIAEGNSNKEIAIQLGVSVRTVETHRERIMRKLRIHTVAGLTKFAISRGLIKLD